MVRSTVFFFVVKLGVGDGSKVDIAGFAVGFAQILQTLGDFFAAEDVAVFHGEKGCGNAATFEMAYCS